MRTKLDLATARSTVGLRALKSDCDAFMVADALTDTEDKELRCNIYRNAAGEKIKTYHVWSCGGLKLSTNDIEAAVSAYNAA